MNNTLMALILCCFLCANYFRLYLIRAVGNSCELLMCSSPDWIHLLVSEHQIQAGPELPVEQMTEIFDVIGVAELYDWKGGVGTGVVQSRETEDV